MVSDRTHAVKLDKKLKNVLSGRRIRVVGSWGHGVVGSWVMSHAESVCRFQGFVSALRLMLHGGGRQHSRAKVCVNPCGRIISAHPVHQLRQSIVKMSFKISFLSCCSALKCVAATFSHVKSKVSRLILTSERRLLTPRKSTDLVFVPAGLNWTSTPEDDVMKQHVHPPDVLQRQEVLLWLEETPGGDQITCWSPQSSCEPPAANESSFIRSLLFHLTTGDREPSAGRALVLQPIVSLSSSYDGTVGLARGPGPEVGHTSTG